MGNDGDHAEPVVATYRQIAEHFGLDSGPDAGRLKARRGGWPTEAGNHPRDPVRVRVPRKVWEEANPTRRGPNKDEAASVGQLAAILDRLEQHTAEELREARSLAERQRAEIVELRGQAERLSRDLQVTRGEAMEAQQRAARAEADAAKAEAKAAGVEEELRAKAGEAAEAREKAARAEGELAGLRSRGWVARILGR